MKTAFLGLLIIVSVLTAGAQEQRQVPLVYRMPFSVSLRRDLSTYKAKVGDTIELVFQGEIKDKAGKVLLNAKSKITGHVTEVVKRDKRHPEARLAILVDHAESNGVPFPIHADLCGDLRISRPKPRMMGGRMVQIGPPGNWQVPEDAELKPATDPNIGATLISRQDNIILGSGPTFFICQTPAPADPHP